MIELPREYRDYETGNSSFTKFKILKKLGYVNIDRVQIAHSFGGTVDGYSVALTKKGREAFGHEYDSKRCVVEWKAQQVKDFTPPSDVAGLNISRVNVTGQQTYTGWATNAELRGLFKLRDLPAEAEQMVIMVLKNTGWQVLESAQ